MGRKHVKNILKPVIVHILYNQKYLTKFTVLPLRYYCFKILYHKIMFMSNFYWFVEQANNMKILNMSTVVQTEVYSNIQRIKYCTLRC